MSIKRENVDAELVDISDVDTGRRRPPIRPGEILRGEFLEPMGISAGELAGALKVPRSRIAGIVRGRRAITPDTALRLGRYFGMTPMFWNNLQAHYDLRVADRRLRGKIKREVAPRSI